MNDPYKLSWENIGSIFPSLNIKNVLGVLLIGSWAEGFNHPKSDVDLILICSDLNDSGNEAGEFLAGSFNGVKYDALLIDEALSKEIIQFSKHNKLDSIDIRKLELFYKFGFGVFLLLKNGFEHIQNSFDKVNFKNNLIQFNKNLIFYFYSFFSGQLSNKQLLPALEAAREIFRFTIDIYLAERDFLYPKAKWRMTKLIALNERSKNKTDRLVFDQYKNIEFNLFSDFNQESAVLEAIKHILNVCNFIHLNLFLENEDSYMGNLKCSEFEIDENAFPIYCFSKNKHILKTINSAYLLEDEAVFFLKNLFNEKVVSIEGNTNTRTVSEMVVNPLLAAGLIKKKSYVY
ncbi:hypothetical protein MCL36_17010 [Acinetobacter pittii]|uniref:hypothetical protein n=1 Tax=Acinetobacter pittii TaxID=48296 RepID=UPI001EFE80BA|nr:hypothetical protein [Acinetobacter pittii]MCG9494227.1 hypothetical protein [Acinetobacter pittii]